MLQDNFYNNFFFEEQAMMIARFRLLKRVHFVSASFLMKDIYILMRKNAY
jgi:hypothetical protein